MQVAAQARHLGGGVKQNANATNQNPSCAGEVQEGTEHGGTAARAATHSERTDIKLPTLCCSVNAVHTRTER